MAGRESAIQRPPDWVTRARCRARRGGGGWGWVEWVTWRGW